MNIYDETTQMEHNYNSQNYSYEPRGHNVTGDLNIKDVKLRNFIKKVLIIGYKAIQIALRCE